MGAKECSAVAVQGSPTGRCLWPHQAGAQLVVAGQPASHMAPRPGALLLFLLRSV